jgi:hypothetical protein
VASKMMGRLPRLEMKKGENLKFQDEASCFWFKICFIVTLPAMCDP